MKAYGATLALPDAGLLGFTSPLTSARGRVAHAEVTQSTRQTITLINYITWVLACLPMLYFASVLAPGSTLRSGAWLGATIFGGSPNLFVTWLLIVLYTITPMPAAWCMVKCFYIRRVIMANPRDQTWFLWSMMVTTLVLVMWCCSLTVGPYLLFNAYLDATT